MIRDQIAKWRDGMKEIGAVQWTAYEFMLRNGKESQLNAALMLTFKQL
jgi:hypothetical protein